MAKYNGGYYYNRSEVYGGAKYNTVAYVVLFKLSDVLYVSDNQYELLAKIIVSEKTIPLKEDWSLYSEYKYNENFNINDSDVSVKILFELFENLGIKDLAVQLFVGMYVQDRMDLIEEARTFAEILAKENLDLKEIGDVEALIETMDELGFSDLGEIFAKILAYERLNITDREPQTAISDFYITKDENGLYDVILPFGLIVNYNKTDIPFMPEAIDTSVQLSGTDGELVQDTVYGSRIFDIFAVTSDGLEPYEKEEIKRQIASILHSIKKETKTLTFASSETSFDVKYTGVADISVNAASWMEFELPLKSASSYAHKQFNQTLIGSGLMVNSGSIPVGAVVTITGEVTNPGFTLGDEVFLWEGTVKEGHKLVIDMDGQSCYMLDESNVRTLATKNLKGEYKKIPVGSIVLQANQNTEKHIESVWKEQVLY